jgi:hypothetical protein
MVMGYAGGTGDSWHWVTGNRVTSVRMTLAAMRRQLHPVVRALQLLKQAALYGPWQQCTSVQQQGTYGSRVWGCSAS